MKAIALVVLGSLAASAFAGSPAVSAASAVVLDADTGKVLFEKNADVHRFPASTTKIMTALLLVEHLAPDSYITAPSDVEAVTGSSLHLKPGEKVKAHDMLYALMLRSANDGSYAVAQQIAGSVRGFARMMNLRAQEIGCTRTNFTNPNGLKDPKHMTTAYDLALMAREAMRYPEFETAVQTRVKAIGRSINLDDRTLVNKNKLLAKDGSYEGIKTGYTNPAGHCFVGAATRNGYRIITVVLKSDDWSGDTIALTNWAFAAHERTRLLEAGEATQSVPVANGSVAEVPVGPSRDVFLTLPKGFARPQNFDADIKPLEAPIRAGQRVGSLVIRDAEGFELTVPAVALADVGTRTLVQRVSGAWGFPALGLTVVGGSIYARGRSRRRGPRAFRRKV